jgi:arginyl-tRNA--protein-N-Asp/Glu arginylyltransferase
VPYEVKSSGAKHSYEVEITRASFEEDCFNIFKKYEAFVHKKQDKSQDSYENFLC